MDHYVLVVLEAIKNRLYECNECLMALESDMSESNWDELDEAFKGIGDAVDTIDWVVKANREGSA